MVSLIGALIVILTKCVDFKKCVRKMDWNTLFVMAFAQGIAAGLNDSGAGEMIANAAVRYVGENKILQLVACIVVVTVLTNIMSSTAVAAMMAPIYLQICSSLGSSPYPFMMAIAVGASLTTSTPIGSTAVTMTMVGGYRFSDFFKIGFLLNIFILISTAIIVPLLWTP